MPIAGRKPHTSYGDIGLMTLTIDGPINSENRGITNENEKKCSLRQNRTSILGRGNEEYVLSSVAEEAELWQELSEKHNTFFNEGWEMNMAIAPIEFWTLGLETYNMVYGLHKLGMV